MFLMDLFILPTASCMVTIWRAHQDVSDTPTERPPIDAPDRENAGQDTAWPRHPGGTEQAATDSPDFENPLAVVEQHLM